MSRDVRKPDFCICENKDADQLCGNRTTDQRHCFRYTDRTIPPLPKSEISSLKLYLVIAQPGLCRTWSEIPKTGFLTSRLIYKSLCCKIWPCQNRSSSLFEQTMISWSPDATYPKSLRWLHRKRFLKRFYHKWAWWPSWSCDQQHVRKWIHTKFDLKMAH